MSKAQREPEIWRGANIFCLLSFLFSVYLLSYSGIVHSSDGGSMMSVTESMVKHGGFDTHPLIWSRWTTVDRWAQGDFGPDGTLYSKKGILSSLLAVPLFWLALVTPHIGLMHTTMLLNPIVTALTGVLIYAYARRLNYNTTTGLIAALIFGLGTLAWAYSKFFYSEPVSAFFLFLAAYFLLSFKKRHAPLYLVGAGISAGLAATKISNVVLVPFFALYFLAVCLSTGGEETGQELVPFSTGSRDVWKRNALHALVFGLSLAGPLLITPLYNFVRFNNWTQTGYDVVVIPPSLGLYGLFLSPHKSYFLYSPVLILAVLSFPIFLKRHRAEALLNLSILAATGLFFAQWHDWEGGLSWGPRYLVPTIPFLTVVLLPLIDLALSKRRPLLSLGFALVCALSFAVQLLGASIDFKLYLRYLRALPGLYSPVLAPLVQRGVLRVADLDLAWLRSVAGVVKIDALVLTCTLGLVLLSAWGLVYFTRRTASRTVSLAALVCSLLLPAGLSWFSLHRYYDDPRLGGGPDYHALLDHLQDAARPGDVLVVTNHIYGTFFSNYNKTRLDWYALIKEEGMRFPRTAELFERLIARYRWVWLVVDSVPALREVPRPVERWWTEHAYKVEDVAFSDYCRLLLYSTTDLPDPKTPQFPAEAEVGEDIRLLGYDLYPTDEPLRPGQVVKLSLLWQARTPPGEDYTVFVQLLDASGFLRWQTDRYPVDGFCPTSTWAAGQTIRDNYGLRLPEDLPPGDYRLIAGMYRLATMERLTVRTEAGESDHISLGVVKLLPAPLGPRKPNTSPVRLGTARVRKCGFHLCAICI